MIFTVFVLFDHYFFFSSLVRFYICEGNFGNYKNDCFAQIIYIIYHLIPIYYSFFIIN